VYHYILFLADCCSAEFRYIVICLSVCLSDTQVYLDDLCIKSAMSVTFFLLCFKGKVLPYSLPSVGPGADPGVQAVSPQVIFWVIPSSRLQLLSARPASLSRKRSSDGASSNRAGDISCSLLLIYRPQENEWLSWLGWLTSSGRFTHISGHPSAECRACDRESSPAKDRRSTTVPRHQFGCAIQYM